ncbi:MAG: DUF1501 domain-containing protein [Verrucomicrobiales bacterium]|nr:DUF1501 domain-containing protein [Verrucomicrobiales bacterium]
MNRRNFLRTTSSGFGLTALQSLMAAPVPHRRPKAKNVIFCFMSGGVSHVDSFDPKPRLQQLAGKPMPVRVERTQFNNNGNIFPSPFEFSRHGQSGLEISSMFPEIAKHADDLAIVRSMTTSVNEHAQGNYFMHTGFPFLGHPSAGAWVSYGLGSENNSLPGYVVLQSGKAVFPHGGVGVFSSGFLPAQYQASVIKADAAEPVRNILPGTGPAAQLQQLKLINQLDRPFAKLASDAQVDAAVKNYETAYRMQAAVPDLCDISGESEATKKLYGLDSPDNEKAAYARQALLARRLVERGVRFVELSCLTKGIGAGGAANPWDQHGDLARGHGAMGYQVDQPIAGLLSDLKSRGLLDETIVVWAGEFGRTPFSQGSNGRDHNPFGFSVWLAGGGIKGGTAYGATDEFGYHAVEDKSTVYDLWATVLHLLGLDHEALTYRFGGRDLRLTDVHGNVLSQICA